MLIERFVAGAYGAIVFCRAQVESEFACLAISWTLNVALSEATLLPCLVDTSPELYLGTNDV